MRDYVKMLREALMAVDTDGCCDVDGCTCESARAFQQKDKVLAATADYEARADRVLYDIKLLRNHVKCTVECPRNEDIGGCDCRECLALQATAHYVRAVAPVKQPCRPSCRRLTGMVNVGYCMHCRETL